MSEINVVPYIDVMLVLLVIFMITAPLLTQGVKIDLPDAAAEVVETTETEPLIVSVDSAGRYFINFGGDEAEPVDRATLLNRAEPVEADRERIEAAAGHRAAPQGVDDLAAAPRTRRGPGVRVEAGHRHVRFSPRSNWTRSRSRFRVTVSDASSTASTS